MQFPNCSAYFHQRVDASHQKGLSPMQKCTSTIRQLAYENYPVSVDEYILIGESTTQECLIKFAQGNVPVFGETYLRKRNFEDIHNLLSIGEAHGYPGCCVYIQHMHRLSNLLNSSRPDGGIFCNQTIGCKKGC